MESNFHRVKLLNAILYFARNSKKPNLTKILKLLYLIGANAPFARPWNVRGCLNGGKEQVGRYVSIEEIAKEIEKDVPFYKNSGGGVTFSGGEPVLQWKFVQPVLKQCKEKDIHTVSLFAPGFEHTQP